ncbi:MAG: hypothetical protein CMF46_00275 [Legionellales bacterium]|nr:hypothetical protein [Legionellales bacterium]|tara:strand:- start:1844 stop:3271 length:1428 start_codon:yes stop_codon:yes gene_type:complete
MGKYFISLPQKERQSSVVFATADKLMFINLSRKGKPDLNVGSISDDQRSGRLCWHHIKWVVDPFFSESTLENGVMPRDESDLKRQAMANRMAYNHVSSCKIDNQSYLISSLSNQQYDNEIKQAKSYGCQPIEVLDGQMVWKHLAEFYHSELEQATYIIPCRNTVVVASYEHNKLTLFKQFLYEPEDGEIRDLLLTEVIPYLHHNHIVDKPESVTIIQLGDKFNQTVIEEMKLDFDVDKMQLVKEQSFQDLLIRICATFVICDTQVAYNKRLKLPVFPMVMWLMIMAGIALVKVADYVDIKQQEQAIISQINSAGTVEPVKPVYKAFIQKNVKQSLEINVNDLLSWMTLYIPSNIWLTNMYVSPLKQDYFFSGYTREMNEPYILRNGLADHFSVNQNLFQVDFKSGAEYLIKIKEKNETYTGALGRSQKDIESKKKRTHVLAQYFELSFGNASKRNMTETSNRRSGSSGKVLDKWW